LLNIIKKQKYVGDHIFLIIGWLEIKETMPYLKTIFTNKTIDGPMTEIRKIEIQMALARMGDKEAINYVINDFETKANKNKEYFYLSDLINYKSFFYIKQPEMITYLSTYLDRKEMKPEELNGREPDLDRAMYIACDALIILESKFYPELNSILIEQGYLDKAIYQASIEYYKKSNIHNYKPYKVRACNTETYQAAKKWVAENKGKFKPFDRDSFY
jgi:hypothetical protein